MKAIVLVIVILCSLFLVSCTTTKDYYGLTLINNSQAKDVSSGELLRFLAQDKTDEHPVVPYTHEADYYFTTPQGIQVVGIHDNKGNTYSVQETLHDYVTSGYMCMNFAIDLHNNAEKTGIRCAVITLNVYSPVNDLWTSHCFNGFNTTDKGMVYVDAGWGADNLSYQDAVGNIFINGLVKQGVGDSCTEILGNPGDFKVEW